MEEAINLEQEVSVLLAEQGLRYHKVTVQSHKIVLDKIPSGASARSELTSRQQKSIV